MTSAQQVSLASGAEVFSFYYDYADVADTIVVTPDYPALLNNVEVDGVIRPVRGTDDISLAGSWTTSVGLHHLDAFASARVETFGSGFTVQYSLNSTNWLTLPSNGIINISTGSYFDLRINFPGAIANDPAVLSQIVVTVLGTNTLESLNGRRVMDITDDRLVNGTLDTTGSVVVNAAPAPGTGETEAVIGSIEAWITPRVGPAITLNGNLLSLIESTAESGTASGNGGVTATSQLDTSWSVHGGSSRRVNASAGATGSVGDLRWTTSISSQTREACTPGETVSAEATINPGNITKNFTLYIEFFTTTNAYITSTNVKTQALTGVTTLKGSATVPSNAAYMHVLVLTGQPIAGAYFLVDAIGLYRGAAPAAWIPGNSLTTYVNGSVGAIQVNKRQHLVVVPDSPVNIAFTLGPNVLVEHLAVYETRMGAPEVTALWKNQIASPLRITDTASFTLTEQAQATKIYAYDWTKPR